MNPIKNINSSNVIAPTLIVGIFSAFFTIYAQGSFIKSRKKEFGTFMVLGMTTRNIRRIILIENSIIAIFSLIIGLTVGSIFSRLFYYVVNIITDISSIPFKMSIMSYLYTIAFFMLIYFFIIAGSFVASTRYNIVKLIKSSREEDKNFLGKPIWAIIGMVLTVLALIDVAKNADVAHSEILLRSMILCFTGIYFLISSSVRLLSKLKKLFDKKINESNLFIADLKYGFGRSKNVIFLIILLTSITMFFCNLAEVLLSDSLNYALKHNPYDFAIYEINGFNKINDSVINDIASKSETPLLSIKALDVVTISNNLMLLSDKNINMELGTDIFVEKGKFISLLQIVKDDGYPHNINEVKSITLSPDSKEVEFKSQGMIIKMLFNSMGDNYYILNDNDFEKIKENSQSIGSIKLISFKDWRKTESVFNHLQSELLKYNKEHIKYYNDDAIFMMSKPLSKIGEFLDRKHGGSYLLFLIGFVSLLFFIASGVILHFQLQTEYESEKIKYKKLYKIGITSKEISRLISKKLRVFFITPIMASALLAAWYCFFIYQTKTEKIESIKYSVLIGLFYIFFQLIYYYIYKIQYIKRLIKTLDETT